MITRSNMHHLPSHLNTLYLKRCIRFTSYVTFMTFLILCTCLVNIKLFTQVQIEKVVLRGDAEIRITTAVDKPECKAMKSWQTTPRPSCNIIHEINLVGDNAWLLGNGGWRAALRISNPRNGLDIVLKTLMTKKFDDLDLHPELGPDTLHRHLVDAVILEHFSSSKFTSNIYGYCGHAVLNEFVEKPFTTLIKNLKNNERRTRKKRHSSLKTSMKELEYATQVALALAELHNFDAEGEATVVYKDLKPPNLRVNSVGELKLIDFNDAELMQWNATVVGNKSRCEIFRRSWPSPYNSPEDLKEIPLSELGDVYALGGIIYFILTGENPYYEKSIDKAMKDIEVGKRPKLSAKIRERDNPATNFLIKIMYKCWTRDVTKRPSSRQISNLLQDKLRSLTIAFEEVMNSTKLEAF